MFQVNNFGVRFVPGRQILGLRFVPGELLMTQSNCKINIKVKLLNSIKIADWAKTEFLKLSDFLLNYLILTT